MSEILSDTQEAKSMRLINSWVFQECDRTGEVENTNNVSNLVAGGASCTIIQERLNHCM